MNAPEWRKHILAGVKPLLRELGFRGSHTRFWKAIGNRQLSLQLLGGSDQHDTQKLSMQVLVGIDFLELGPFVRTSAYLSFWHGPLCWTTTQGVREVDWRAYSDAEAMEVLEGIQTALPPALAIVEERFQSWHDALIYLNKDIRDKLDPPGRVKEYLLPNVL